MVSLIQSWTTPVDPGGGNPGRIYLSPVIGAGWTHLTAAFQANGGWSGAFRIEPGEHSALWFARYPQPQSPFQANDPNQAYVTAANDQMRIDTNNSTGGLQVLVTLEGDAVAPPAYCAYGTRLKPAAQYVYYLTPGLIDLWLATVGAAWLAPIFTALWFSSFNAQELCESGQPQLPVIDLDTLQGSATTILQLFRCIAWPNVCECMPGSPAPTPYPIPAPSQPPHWPTPPTFACSNADLCAALVAMQSQLAALQQRIASSAELVTLIQRYGVPFQYIRGATHSGLTGEGSFAISQLIGVQALVSVPVGPRVILSGNPPYIFDLGWLSISGPDGMIDEQRITRTRQLWLPDRFQSANRLNYWLDPGVVVDLTELEAEP